MPNLTPPGAAGSIGSEPPTVAPSLTGLALRVPVDASSLVRVEVESRGGEIESRGGGAGGRSIVPLTPDSRLGVPAVGRSVLGGPGRAPESGLGLRVSGVPSPGPVTFDSR